MTYARSGQSIPIQLTAGQTLVVKELSGTSSVSGGSAQREAAGFIGAGFVIYGPQSTAATVTLTTTGECDWYVVNGDPQRRDIASLPGDMDQSGNVSKLYTPSGAQVGGGGGATGNTCVLVGDSITAENYTEASPYGRIKAARWFALLNFLLGQRLQVINNAAVSGERTDQILARLSGGNLGIGFGSQSAPGVLGLPQMPAWAFVLAGTNDVNQGRTFDVITGDLLQIYTRLLAAGIRVVALTLTPAGGYTTAQNALLLQVNAWIRNTVAATPGMVLVDAFAALVDPTSATLGGVASRFRDGVLHPNNTGGMAIARAAFAVLDPLIPRSEFLVSSNYESQAFDASCDQLIDNPLFISTAAASGTGVSGTGPAGFTYGTPGASQPLVASLVARADGYGNDLKVNCTATAAAQTHQITAPSVHARAVEGGLYYAAATCAVTGNSGAALTAAANLRAVALRVQLNNGSNSFSADLDHTSTDSAYEGNFSGVFKTPLFYMPGGAVTIFRPFFLLTSHGAGQYEASFGRLTLRRVA